jgi:GxxExxY protein
LKRYGLRKKGVHAKAQRREEVRVKDLEELAKAAVNCGFRIHKVLGPGLLESVYEAILADSLTREGLFVERQKPLPISFEGVQLSEGYRVDLLIEGSLIVEIKSVERIVPVHGKQLLTYLRLAQQPLGLLMNFGGETFKEGIRRVANNYVFAPSRLCVNPLPPVGK